MLNYIEYGTRSDKPDLMIVHGLFGSGRNWSAIGKRLGQERRVISVDQRNHGDSPWFDTHSYEDMARDLAEVIEAQDGPMDVLGHSMGGKATMVLALTRPELVRSLLVADIAPVTYSHDQNQHIQSMRSIDLNAVEKRSDAVAQLSATVDDPALRSFFTQSLDVANKRWKLNLDVLEREMPKILAFPELDAQFTGPTLFLSGANSEYMHPAFRAPIHQYFPQARFAKLSNAGHWLHAEQPRAFIASVQAWLNR